MSELYENWYDGFLAQTDQTLRVEEYEPMITFAKAKRTPLQGIIRYGGITDQSQDESVDYFLIAIEEDVKRLVITILIELNEHLVRLCT